MPEPIPDAPLDPRTVLVVEDEASIRGALSDLFDVPGVLVTAAANTDEALAALRSQSFDLVVTDLRLGAKHDGGLQVMAAAAMLSPEAPVITLTAYPEQRNRLAAGRLGAAHFLEKPADLETIAAIAECHGVLSALTSRRSSAGR
jgi:two-component system response regulator FlrC